MMRQSIRSTGSSGASSTPGRRSVQVILLNREELTVYIEGKARVQDVFNQACDHLGLRETDYFGLALVVEGEYQFQKLDTKLHKLAPKLWKSKTATDQPVLTFYFRVQYYVENITLLRERVTRSLYYLQLRDNLLNHSQSVTEEKCFLTAAYALQADYGDYVSRKATPPYFDPREYFPAWVVDKHGNDYILQHTPTLHADLRGQTKMEAQLHFIRDVSVPPIAHSLHFYKLKKKKTDELGSIWMGICAKGIEIYEVLEYNNLKSLLVTFLWPEIEKLHHDKKKFELATKDKRKFVYYTGSDDRSKYLFTLSQSTHHFHMSMQPKLAEIKHMEETDKRYRESYIFCENTDSSYETERSSVHSRSSLHRAVSGGRHSPRSRQNRISMISSISSNTTSGIVSDRHHASLDDSEDIRSPTPALQLMRQLGGHPSVSRSSSGHSQKSGKLSLLPSGVMSPLASTPARISLTKQQKVDFLGYNGSSGVMNNMIPATTVAPSPIAVKTQIQRSVLPQTMMVNSRSVNTPVTRGDSGASQTSHGYGGNASPSLPRINSNHAMSQALQEMNEQWELPVPEAFQKIPRVTSNHPALAQQPSTGSQRGRTTDPYSFMQQQQLQSQQLQSQQLQMQQLNQQSPSQQLQQFATQQMQAQQHRMQLQQNQQLLPRTQPQTMQTPVHQQARAPDIHYQEHMAASMALQPSQPVQYPASQIEQLPMVAQAAPSSQLAPSSAAMVNNKQVHVAAGGQPTSSVAPGIQQAITAQYQVGSHQQVIQQTPQIIPVTVAQPQVANPMLKQMNAQQAQRSGSSAGQGAGRGVPMSAVQTVVQQTPVKQQQLQQFKAAQLKQQAAQKQMIASGNQKALAGQQLVQAAGPQIFAQPVQAAPPQQQSAHQLTAQQVQQLQVQQQNPSVPSQQQLVPSQQQLVASQQQAITKPVQSASSQQSVPQQAQSVPSQNVHKQLHTMTSQPAQLPISAQLSHQAVQTQAPPQTTAEPAAGAMSPPSLELDAQPNQVMSEAMNSAPKQLALSKEDLSALPDSQVPHNELSKELDDLSKLKQKRQAEIEQNERKLEELQLLLAQQQRLEEEEKAKQEQEQLEQLQEQQRQEQLHEQQKQLEYEQKFREQQEYEQQQLREQQKQQELEVKLREQQIKEYEQKLRELQIQEYEQKMREQRVKDYEQKLREQQIQEYEQQLREQQRQEYQQQQQQLQEQRRQQHDYQQLLHVHREQLKEQALKQFQDKQLQDYQKLQVQSQQQQQQQQQEHEYQQLQQLHRQQQEYQDYQKLQEQQRQLQEQRLQYQQYKNLRLQEQLPDQHLGDAGELGYLTQQAADPSYQQAVDQAVYQQSTDPGAYHQQSGNELSQYQGQRYTADIGEEWKQLSIAAAMHEEAALKQSMAQNPNVGFHYGGSSGSGDSSHLPGLTKQQITEMAVELLKQQQAMIDAESENYGLETQGQYVDHHNQNGHYQMNHLPDLQVPYMLPEARGSTETLDNAGLRGYADYPYDSETGGNDPRSYMPSDVPDLVRPEEAAGPEILAPPYAFQGAEIQSDYELPSQTGYITGQDPAAVYAALNNVVNYGMPYQQNTNMRSQTPSVAQQQMYQTQQEAAAPQQYVNAEGPKLPSYLELQKPETVNGNKQNNGHSNGHDFRGLNNDENHLNSTMLVNDEASETMLINDMSAIRVDSPTAEYHTESQDKENVRPEDDDKLALVNVPRGRKWCPKHNRNHIDEVRAKNSSMPMLSGLLNAKDLLQCRCHDDNEEKRKSYAHPAPERMWNEPGTVVRPMSWHCGNFTPEQTLTTFKELNIGEAQNAGPLIGSEVGDVLVNGLDLTALKSGSGGVGAQGPMGSPSLVPARLHSGGHSPNNSDPVAQQKPSLGVA